nr:hypothetical protein [Tanacetum cinerariifolium]
MAGSKGKRVVNALCFYQMETDEVSERYIAPCFVNGLEAYDGEINLVFDENLISNEFAVKLCLNYEKILDEIKKDKVELDGMVVKEKEEAIKKVKGKIDDPIAFIFPIRLEGQVDENALAGTGSDINIIPYQICEQLGGGHHFNCKIFILDTPIDRDVPIVVGQGFLSTIGGIVNTPERLYFTFDGICHHTFCDARSDVLRTAKSDSDDEEEYEIKRNNFRAPIYGPKPAPYLNCTNPEDRSSAIQIITNHSEKLVFERRQLVSLVHCMCH